MSKHIRITEADLMKMVKEAAMSIIKEYGDRKDSRRAMGMAAKRGIERGDASPYLNAMNSLQSRRSSEKDYNDFKDGFE